MYWIIKFCIFESGGIECNGSGSFPTSTKGEDSTCASVAGISGDENFVCVEFIMINNCEAFPGYNYLFNFIEGGLIFVVPRREIFCTIFSS